MPAAPESVVTVTKGEVRQGTRTVLRGVDLDLSVGITVVLGSNGIGKSTLLRTIATLHPLAAGELSVAGGVVRSLRDAKRARRSIGYLDQEPDFPRRFTVSEALFYAAWLRKIPNSAAAVDRTLSQLRLAEHAHTQLRRLSGGTRRRALIGQAIIHDPPVLIMDEPTVGMDIEHRVGLRHDLQDLAKNRVVILTTHVLDDVDALTATLIILGDSTIAFVGSHDELLERARALGGEGLEPDRLLEFGITKIGSTDSVEVS